MTKMEILLNFMKIKLTIITKVIFNFINKKLSVKWDFSLKLNYTRGYGFYEEYNNNQSFSSLMLEDIEIGNSTLIPLIMETLKNG